MHRRLRRLVELHLGPGQLDPAVRTMLREVDEDYRRADQDRESLDRALALISDVANRRAAGPPALPRVQPSPGARLTRRLFQEVPLAGFVCDPSLTILGWNRAAERLFGVSAADALDRGVPALLFGEEVRAEVARELGALVARGEPHRALRVSRPRGGDPRQDEWTVVPLRDRGGRIQGAAVLVREPQGVSEHQAAACAGTGDALFDWDVGGGRLWLSDAWPAIAGGPAPTGKPTDWLERIHPLDRDQVERELRGHLEGRSERFESEHRVRHASGDWRWILARGRAARDGAGAALRLSGSMMDVTDRRAAADRALHDALHDPITRLPNRAMFLDLVKRSFARARRREGYAFAVMFLDMDRFKAVNDGLGHAAGDDLLAQMAKRLQSCLREGDTLARHGGDEFTVLLDDVKGPPDAHTVAERIHHATSQPFLISGHEVFSTVSVGVAISTPTYGRPEDLLLDADTAMYRAKAMGRARTAVFDPSMRERAPQLLDLEADLRRALLREEFRVHYLPVVDVATGRIQGLEALIRWAHPKRGLVAPEHFIPFAEETGLIVPIGAWVLHQAGRDFETCRRTAAAGPLTLHVNLSPKQLQTADLLDQIDEVIEENHLGPGELAVELTEHTLQQKAIAGRVTELRERGVRLCMDDFGAEYSSLSSLHRFALDSLKIDRSLFTGGSPQGRAPELVRSIVSLARELGTGVVAEGVETAEQFSFLRELGCGAAQGFFFSPPVEGNVAASMLASGASW